MNFLRFLTLPDRIIGNSTAFSLLALRLAVGGVFIMHGYQKAFEFGLKGTADFLRSVNIPFADLNAPLVIGTELIGGIMIVLGLATRWISIPLAFTMVVAFITVHGNKGFFLATNGWEFVGVLFLGCISLLLSGAGALSLDALIKGLGSEEFQTRG